MKNAAPRGQAAQIVVFPMEYQWFREASFQRKSWETWNFLKFRWFSWNSMKSHDFHEISRKSINYAEIAKFHLKYHYSYNVLRQGVENAWKVLKLQKNWKSLEITGKCWNMQNIMKLVKMAGICKNARKLWFGPIIH